MTAPARHPSRSRLAAQPSALLGAALAAALAAPSVGCKKAEAPTTPAPQAAAPKFDRLTRAEFNQLAAERFLPLFWREDANGNGAVDADEVARLWGFGESEPAWVEDGKLTPGFADAYAKLVAAKAGPHDDDLEDAERARRKLIREELAQGKPTLVETHLAGATAEDRAILDNVLQAAVLVERLYARQEGTLGLDAKIPLADHASRAVFHRNQSPRCAAPATESNPACTATPSVPKVLSGLYPAALQEDPKFCEKLARRKDAQKLLDPFVVVQGEGDQLTAVPYSDAYREEMTAVSERLKAAAAAITSEGEAAFKAYLEAAAQAFLDNQWTPADEAWSRMSVHNSKWYLRIGPDEVYFEPCSQKAGFHVSFARINQDSLAWQTKLDPVKQELEDALAALAGKPYAARTVSFHLPDFIDIIINAGDSRPAHGATIGQSLPNWGPVANEGRGRTVAMTNLYTDPDSRQQLEAQAASLLCKATMGSFSADPKPAVMSTVLHEAAHNLGPAHEYKVRGKAAPAIFGGPLASTMEELKAQTAALYFADWLANKGVITREEADRAHLRDLVWSFGHISRGMYDADGKPKNYSQLAAIQLGWLVEKGAVTFKPEELAANGKDQGCFELQLQVFPAAAEGLMKVVAAAKGSGDKKAAEGLVKTYVDAEGETRARLELIKERWLRAPKATFVYSVRL
jgi:hypothetical protein